MRIFATIALLAAVVLGLSYEAHAYTCTTTCFGNMCTTNCF